MFSLLASWLLSALAIFLVSQYLPGFQIASFKTSLIVALVLGVVNAVIKPVLTILTLPITIVTLGLFTFVINAVLILLVAKLVPGFVVNGFFPALIAGAILWLINHVINALIPG